MHSHPHYDAIVVLGCSFTTKNGQYAMSAPGLLRIAAASELLEKGIADRLILSGGKTKGKNHPSEAWVMRTGLPTKFLKKPYVKKIVLEEASKTTLENIRYSLVMCDAHRWKKVAFLSNAFHLPRVRMLLAQESVQATSLSAEDIVMHCGSLMLKKRIAAYQKTGMMYVWKMSEAWSRFFVRVDKKGNISSFFARIVRSH